MVREAIGHNGDPFVGAGSIDENSDFWNHMVNSSILTAGSVIPAVALLSAPSYPHLVFHKHLQNVLPHDVV